MAGVVAGPELCCAIATIDESVLDGEGLAELLVAQSRLASHEQAQLLRLMHAVAQAVPVAEFAAEEIACALALTSHAAELQLELAKQLIDVLPAVWSTLDRGLIDLPRARVFADVLATAEPGIARQVADAVLPKAAGKTTTQLRDMLRRKLLKLDSEHQTKVRQRAEQRRAFVMQPEPDGTATLTAWGLPAAKAAAAYERVTAIAKARRAAGDASTLDQLRADVMLDLLAGTAAETSSGDRKGVIELQVGLATLAGLDEEPGMLGSYGAVGADIARQVAAQNPRYQWRFTVSDDETGQVLNTGLTRARPGDKIRGPRRPSDNRPASRDSVPCPPEQDPAARFPNAAMRRWISTRDRTCRWPGCRRPAYVCDYDHTVDIAHGGQTKHDNLSSLCRHHHRAKHEGGWTVQQPRPGYFIWTSPLKQSYEIKPEPP